MQHAIKYRLVPEAQVAVDTAARIAAMRQRLIDLLDDPTLRPFERRALYEELLHRFQGYKRELEEGPRPLPETVVEKKKKMTSSKMTQIPLPKKDYEVDMEEFRTNARRLTEGLKKFASGLHHSADEQTDATQSDDDDLPVSDATQVPTPKARRKKKNGSHSSRRNLERTRTQLGVPRKKPSRFVTYTSFGPQNPRRKRKTRKTQKGKGRVFRWMLY